jgi:predicted enzyme related to lactoylglutathione lyase
MIELSNTVHSYARPESKERLLEFYSVILGLTRTPASSWTGPPEDFYAFRFSNGRVLSGEFTEDALDDEHARRGIWLELRTDDAEALQQKALAFGVKRIVHPYTSFFYIQAPGGQVFRIVSSHGR